MFSVDENYVFGVEPLAENIEACKPLFLVNHKETSVYRDKPFDPDYDRYLALAAQRDLAFFTVRAKANMQIVGFALFFLDTEIQAKEALSARQSLNFVLPEHRGVGYRFMKFCDDILKNQGVNSIWRQATTKFDISPVYERLGYELVEKVYLRRL